ncbi:MAG: hypothetical protein HC876_12245 [Chloroflexaceae bacterium]|nr:hypothetical protein [Chloroflexaceae bacterium]NJK90998.1 hypothetical protein [Blastochloris sp.]NJO06218.1 hypothetical protein [Chloroflexaceae bacterium]
MSAASHIPYEKLVDLVEGRLSAEECHRLQAALAGDPAAAAEVERLKHIVALMRGDSLEAAPAAVIKRAVHLFQPAQPGTVADVLRRIVAVLRFDSLHTPLAMGVRQAHATERQLMYTAEDYDVDIRIASTDTRWRVAGQLLGPNEGAAGTVELIGPTGKVQTILNELSEFTFPSVERGRYTLFVRRVDVGIVIAGLEIGLS